MKNNSLSNSSYTKMGESSKIFTENPINNQQRKEADACIMELYEYNADEVKMYELSSAEECRKFVDSPYNIWLNIDGLKKENIHTISEIFGIHDLIEEDIYSEGHSTKIDVTEKYIYALVYMLSYSSKGFYIEQEQVSMLLGRNILITFQEEAEKDAFKKVRARLQNPSSKIRQNAIDFLFYELLDAIVDDYFYLMDKLSARIETVEDEVLRNQNKRSFDKIIFYRKELMILRRNIYPLRDLITILMRNEGDFFKKRTLSYLKDVSDHISQAKDMVENYRESIENIQDLYLNQENTKLNQSMKVTAIVTCLLAPATVIGGIYGMNFDSMPFLHSKYAFYICLTLMLAIPLYMVYVFKKKGWF